MELPEWVINLVGRLILENELLRQQVAALMPSEPATEPAE